MVLPIADRIPFFVRIHLEVVQLIKFRVLYPMNEFVAIRPDRLVVGVQNPRERPIITKILNQHRGTPYWLPSTPGQKWYERLALNLFADFRSTEIQNGWREISRSVDDRSA